MIGIKAICDQVRQTAYDVHVYHGHGHLEKVYENALVHRLKKAGLHVEQQHPIQVLDEAGTVIGEYFADLIVEHCLIIELKTAKTIAPEHEAQVLGYLKSTRREHGLLINFGSYRFQIRKYTWGESGPKNFARRSSRPSPRKHLHLLRHPMKTPQRSGQHSGSPPLSLLCDLCALCG